MLTELEKKLLIECIDTELQEVAFMGPAYDLRLDKINSLRAKIADDSWMNRSYCINCQVLGMQKAVGVTIDFDFIEDGLKDEIVTKMVEGLNAIIEGHVAFKQYAKHKLSCTIHKGKNFSCNLITIEK
ncbi:hypothetical protein WSM22_03170 [Cytophagales bacterium WSM2-2]|nr:hypothetical protein WSM22_03170 [Cytophagales bacterium WSM2-2]